MSNAMKQQEYALATLEFLKTDLSLDIVLTHDEFNELYGRSEARGVGPKYGVAIHHSMDKLLVRKIVREAEIPSKDFYRDQLTQTIRTIGTHKFITDVLEKDNPESDLVIYSKARLDKSMDKLNEWASKTTPVVAPAKPKTKTPAPPSSIHHPLEVVSAMREMRHLADTVKISVHPFNEEKIKKSSTLANGVVDYKTVSDQLRHNHTNYDVLRLARKTRRNTYWKLTAQPAIRIAVCEKLLLMTEDPALHFRLIHEIELTNAEFQKRLTAAAKEPNFTAAIDAQFTRVVKKKVFSKIKSNFMLCLETI